MDVKQRRILYVGLPFEEFALFAILYIRNIKEEGFKFVTLKNLLRNNLNC